MADKRKVFLVLILNTTFFCRDYALFSDLNIVDAEVKLLDELFYNYNRHIIPNFNRSTPILISIKGFLSDIVAIDKSRDIMTSYAFFDVSWIDQVLRERLEQCWNVSKYGEIANLHVSYDRIWLPDLTFNSIGKTRKLPKQTDFVSLRQGGQVTYWPGGLMKTKCQVDVTKFPFDSQTCDIEIEAWESGDSRQVIGIPSDNEGVQSLRLYSRNSEWHLIDVEEYLDTDVVGSNNLTSYVFRIHIKRRMQYYVLNLVLPVVILSIINMCCFLIPSSCGEKMTLSISTFLTFAIYITIISGEMPKSSTEISAFAVFVLIQLFLSGLIIFECSFLLYFLHKNKKIVCLCKFTSTSNDRRSSNAEEEEMNDSEDKDNSREDMIDNLNTIIGKTFLFINIVSITIFVVISLQ